MFVDVVVFVPGDPKKSTFTYSLPDHFLFVKLGFMVIVPYGNKSVNGIVIKIHDLKPEFDTKEIIAVAFESAVLTEYLIDTAIWMSEYYHESLRNCIETITIFKRKVRLSKQSVSLNHPEKQVELREEQLEAYLKIKNAYERYEKFLLFGITGSGKTEIYLHVIKDLVVSGKQVIYLVPEIALTPQTISRVEKKFPGQTVVFHSQISEGERYRAFMEVVSGAKKIVIGSRSALFAPLPFLGAIIIDEEHDHSYKQESRPRYNVIKTAEFISSILNIPLILGSATPRVDEFYYCLEKKDLTMLRLLNRSTSARLPDVQIVDMREELKKRHFSTISDELEDNIRRTLSKKEQVLLFLNKRGLASSLMCRMCGWTAECPRCELALTIHKELYGKLSEMLLCHHCDFQMKIPLKCPECDSLYLKTLGSGTEKIEEDIRKILPQARVLRMDRDTTTQKGSHQRIYDDFLNHKADILIGTQMIAKGWDIANVTLVGIVNADTALHMPHFKAAERVFSLITQVSGRAGRADKAGKAILQTYNPEHYAILAASKHDYHEFYNLEIGFRKQLNYPPISQMARLEYSNVKLEKVEYQSAILHNKLKPLAEQLSVQVLGPAPAIIPKKRNKWYYQIILMGDKKSLDIILNHIGNDWIIDVDPES